ncbi:MAG TPA: NAD(P)-dependent glycerol-3-phosphate dehydrogenase [Dehalococcoidia bacterium]|nr:NAD(P)-dependent glycerol-3-phosphate dehydrogenase [Dehalococcoidia bacterium]
MSRVAIIGTTTWGTTLGIMLTRKGTRVRLWARSALEAQEINRTRENAPFLPGVRLPRRLTATASMEEALDRAALVIMAVPAQTMRANIRLASPYLKPPMLILSAAKGLEVGDGKRMSEVIAEEIEPALHPNICALSGPNLAKEIIGGLPAVTVVAASTQEVAERIQQLLSSPRFCVFTNTDLVGVELGGALKNIIALGAGIADGLGYGDNAKAAFITRGLAEIATLGLAAGANPLTFAGLAGLGDLIATCSSRLSRNHYVGEELGKGRSLAEITASMRSIAEGIDTTRAALHLAQRLGVEMPITQVIYRILFQGLDPRRGVAELMGRPAGSET